MTKTRDDQIRSEARREALEEAAVVATRRFEELEARGNRSASCWVECVENEIRALIDQPPPDTVTVPREPRHGTVTISRKSAEHLINSIEELRDYPWPADWACAECKPESDILVDGFQCSFHELRAAMIEAAK